MENYSHPHDNGNSFDRTFIDIDPFNRIQAMVPILAPLFGVIFKGHISLNKAT
jgi:hypothetical protein